MGKKNWINFNGSFFHENIPSVSSELPKGIYEIDFDGFKKQFFLKYITESFELPQKIYGIENELHERIIITFKSMNKNFGVLLKGLKGTGKTIAAKKVSNELKLPVILINKAYADLGHFINGIEQDVILFFDEFEKTYSLHNYNDDADNENEKKSINHLLTLMDGVFTSSHKRLFLLTTNETYLPDPMMARPSRIRYIKDFSDLNNENIVEILEDSVKNKKLIPDLLEILKELEHITVDIVKSMAEEANIYNKADKKFFEIFNVSRPNDHYDIYEIFKNGKEKLVEEGHSTNIESYYEGYAMNLKHSKIRGVIQNIDIEENKITLKDSKSDSLRTLVFKKGLFIHKSMMA